MPTHTPEQPPNLPAGKKMYYSISEVCAMTGLEPHILRYWEAEFSKLRPKKNSAGKRAYRDKDIELIGQIKRLLHDEKYTLDGAKKKIADERKSLRSPTTLSMPVVPSEPVAKSTRSRKTTVSMPIIEQSTAASLPNVPQDLISDMRKGLMDVLTLLEG